MLGKLLVDNGKGTVDMTIGFLYTDVEGVGRNSGAVCESHHIDAVTITPGAKPSSVFEDNEEFRPYQKDECCSKHSSNKGISVSEQIKS
jgi:hypothetical protein